MTTVASSTTPGAADSPPTTRRVHYVFSTHWDREWYQPFQHYRMRLVQLMDEVIAGIEDGSFRGPFQMDGQTILIDDYLEVRPERRPTIERLLRSGRLVIGPWYVLPDEFLVSGESIVRNLRRGRKSAEAFGIETSKAGFVCDLFGHISQLPQILAGFGVRGVLLWRGVNPRGTRQLRWTGSDGTCLPAYHFGRRGYCDYASNVRWGLRHDQRATTQELHDALDEWLDRELDLSVIDAVLAFDGGDHQHWDRADYAGVIDRIEQRDDVTFVHSTLDDFLDELIQQEDRITEEVAGELREPGFEAAEVDEQWVIPGVASSRAWIKQANASCQTLLTKWVEPFLALDRIVNGTEVPQGLVDLAWDWLLKNHPHDSIGGCSVDRVHQDMRFRFSQCEQIGEKLAEQALTRLTLAAIGGRDRIGRLCVGVGNPDATERRGIHELALQIPGDWPTFNEFFGYEAKPAFRLVDENGDELPYQLLKSNPGRKRLRLRPHRFPDVGFYTQATVAVELSVPATGVAPVFVEPGEANQPTRHPVEPAIVRDHRTLENEAIRIVVGQGGTLEMTDKATGRRYANQLIFEDSADIGDGWYHGPPVLDEVVTTLASSADVSVVSQGPMLGRLRILTRMSVPRCFDRATCQRSAQRIPLEIESTITLRRGEAFFDVQTRVENRACDHRLRVLFESGCTEAQTARYDSAFDVVERPIALRKDNHRYRELEIETKPQQSWVSVADSTGGLAIMANGLNESAVLDRASRPVALTLFRSTDTTVMTNGEPDGQLQGPMTFDFRVMPHAADASPAAIARVAASFTAGTRAVHLHANDWPADTPAYADAPVSSPIGPPSLINIDGPVLVSAALPHESGGYEVRLYNPESESADVGLTAAPHRLEQSEIVDLSLDGSRIGEVGMSPSNSLNIVVGPRKIRTLLIIPRTETS